MRGIVWASCVDDDEGTPEQAAFESEWRRLIWLLVAELPQRQAELLRLRYWEELTIREIAGRWHVWPSAVHGMEARALRALRESLEAAGIRTSSHVL